MTYNLHPECSADSGIHQDIARRARVDERAKMIAELETMRDEYGLGPQRVGIRAAIARLRSLSPLGPTHNRKRAEMTTLHHVEAFVTDYAATWGWQCFTCGKETTGYASLRAAEVAAGGHVIGAARVAAPVPGLPTTEREQQK